MSGLPIKKLLQEKDEHLKTLRKELHILHELDEDKVEKVLREYILEKFLYYSIDDKERIYRYFFHHFMRLGRLQELIDDVEINEIMINGFDEIYIEKSGEMEQIPTVFETKEELDIVIQKIVAKMNRKVNAKDPICDVRLEDGSRVNIVLDPVAINGPIVTIRKFPEKKLCREDIIQNMTVSREVMEFLTVLVQKKYNIFISGGTSSGKTTLLNILSDDIYKDERVITIEDSAELQIKNIENLVKLEAKGTRGKEIEDVSIKDLIRTSLRMRPDRIIVGEVRGEECIDMLQALNTGHDGSISTGHGNNPKEMLYRMETMVLTGIQLPLYAIRQQIASAIDIMVHIQKIRGKGRRITEVVEVIGMEAENIKLHSLYTYNEKVDVLEKKGDIYQCQKMKWG